jgi:cytochrome b561
MKSASDSMHVYDSRTIVLHWVTAAFVVMLWILGQCIDFFPKGVPRMSARSTHIVFGALLALLLAARIAWRLRAGAKLAPAHPGISGQLAVGAHYLLYALLATTVLVGIACEWFRGDTLFNVFTVPAFDPIHKKKLSEPASDLHALAANALLVLAGLHAAAAIFHHSVRRDQVLRRMWPSLSQARGEKQKLDRQEVEATKVDWQGPTI